MAVDTQEVEVRPDPREEKIAAVLDSLINDSSKGVMGTSADEDPQRRWRVEVSLSSANLVGGETSTAILSVTSFPDRQKLGYREDGSNTLGWVELNIRDDEQAEVHYALRRRGERISQPRHLGPFSLGEKTTIKEFLEREIMGIRNARPVHEGSILLTFRPGSPEFFCSSLRISSSGFSGLLAFIQHFPVIFC